jgi:hypothetical protein
VLAHPTFRRWLDRSLASVEGAAVERLRLAPRRPPLFVLGAPRAGTTALFLTLVNGLRLGFFPNLAKRHPRAPVSYALLGALGGGYRPTFANRFGALEAPMAPSDGWHIFTRWLPNEACDEGAAEGAETLRTLVRAFELLHGAPFCVRNNVNSLRIAPLRRLFPEAVFVASRRDWRETALSLAEATRAHGTPPDAWWSAGPPDVDPGAFDDPLEKAVYQVLGVEALMLRDLAAVPDGHQRLVAYDTLCARPDAVVEAVRGLYAHLGVRVETREPGLATRGVRRSGRRVALDAPTRRRLECAREAFLRGARLRSERALTPAVRALVAEGA